MIHRDNAQDSSRIKALTPAFSLEQELAKVDKSNGNPPENFLKNFEEKISSGNFREAHDIQSSLCANRAFMSLYYIDLSRELALEKPSLMHRIWEYQDYIINHYMP